MKKSLFVINVIIALMASDCVLGQTDYIEEGCVSTYYGFDIPVSNGDPDQIYDSRNGSKLSPHDTIKMLMIFVELEYSNSSLDPSIQWSNSNYWIQGHLPIWADTLLSSDNPVGLSQKTITKYFQLASSNDHIVLGDYLIAPTNNGVFSINTDDGDVTDLLDDIVQIINSTVHNNIVLGNSIFSINDFDRWTPNGLGLEKTKAGNGKWDYVVFLIRNATTPENKTGRCAVPSLPLLGHEVDAGALICAGNINTPTHIIRHEYAHMLLGGNDFHTCGGGKADSHNYWIPQTGGWALLGLYESSLMCWNAWDRYRLGWYDPNNAYDISARAADGTTEVNGDIDSNSSNNVFVLRDFVTTGDALRIKLPFIDTINEYQEWIWLENHQGVANNNVVFDQWQYQGYNECVDSLVPGIMAYVQINSNTRTSTDYKKIYSQFADYLNPIMANGLWDRFFPVYTVGNECVSSANVRPFIREHENPLTGGSDQSHYTYDINGDDNIRYDDQLNNWVEYDGNNYFKNLFQLGHGSHSFTLHGNNKIGISTNPSSASLINMVGQEQQATHAKNLRTTYLNGISIEILEQDVNGNIKVRVRFDDVDVDNDVRWCSDSIVLNEIPTTSGYSLNVKPGKTILLAQGLTATRMTDPITFFNQKVFASPTTFTIQPDVSIHLDTTARIVLDSLSNSKIHFSERSSCVVENNAAIVVKSGTIFQMDDCSTLTIRGMGKLIVENGAELRISNHVFFDLANGAQNIVLGNDVTIPEGYANPLALISPEIGNTQINGLVVWNGYNKIVRGVITVNNGATLKLVSSFLRFEDDHCGIIVDRGGKLIVDGSTLTAVCHNTDNMWKGIEVWGNTSQHQFSVNNDYLQGCLELKNGAIIENAICAVKLDRTNYRCYTGGIIHATDAVFRNNAMAVDAPHSYTNINPVSGAEEYYNGKFENCTFTINDDYPGTETFNKHVNMSSVNGITFKGCVFDVNQNITGVSPECMGICANNAGFKVIANCQDGIILPCPDYGLIRSTFTNFYNGIYSSFIGSNSRSLRVENAVFANNTIGIYADNIGFATIVGNEFNIPDIAECNYGIYANNIMDFCIEENAFSNESDNCSNDILGIGIFNSASVNDIYLNTLTNLTCGNLACGVNNITLGNNVFAGLTYTCNHNVGNDGDFCVLRQNHHGGIDMSQGSELLPAGNTFSGSIYHFYNDGDYDIYYYHNSTNAYEIPDPTKTKHVNLRPVTYFNACNSHYGRDGGGVLKSPKEIAELEKIYKTSDDPRERYRAAGDIVRSYIHDTVVNYAELRTWLGNMHNINADRMIVASFIQEGDFANALKLASALPAVYGLQGNGLTDHNDYMRLLYLYQNLYNSNRTIFEMTSVESTMVDDIAQNGVGNSKSIARAIVREVSGRDAETNYCSTLPSQIIRSSADYVDNPIENTDFTVSVSPSPASSWATFEYHLPNNLSKATITIINSLGVRVLEFDINDNKGNKTIDLRNMTTGVYSYMVKCGDYVKTGRLVITK